MNAGYGLFASNNVVMFSLQYCLERTAFVKSLRLRTFQLTHNFNHRDDNYLQNWFPPYNVSTFSTRYRQPQWNIDLNPVKNILLIRLKSMGDVVFTLPAVNLVRENFPNARITFLTASENRAIVEQFDAVDEVLSLDRQLFKKRHFGKGCAMLWGLIKKLRSGKFSLSIDLQSYGETALLTRLTGAKERWAWVIGNKFRRHAYTRITPKSEYLHPVDINLEMLTQFGLKAASIRNEIKLSDQGRDEAHRFFKENGLDINLPTFVIQAFTSASHKNWPMDNYLTVAKHWKDRGYQIVFSGGPKEKEQLEPAARAGFPICIVPLSTACWLMKTSRLVIGGDTGLLHLGVAIGKRVVVLMSPDGARTPIPYGHVKWVVWTPSGSDIKGITTDSVNRAIEKALIPGEDNVIQGMPASGQLWVLMGFLMQSLLY